MTPAQVQTLVIGKSLIRVNSTAPWIGVVIAIGSVFTDTQIGLRPPGAIGGKSWYDYTDPRLEIIEEQP